MIKLNVLSFLICLFIITSGIPAAPDITDDIDTEERDFVITSTSVNTRSAYVTGSPDTKVLVRLYEDGGKPFLPSGAEIISRKPGMGLDTGEW